MATDLVTPLITPEQLAAMPNDKDFELVDGRLLERKMGNKSNWIATNFAIVLSQFVTNARLGWIFTSEAGFRLNAARPNNVRKPDVSFVRFGRLPDEEPAEGYDYLAPDLVVEVISPGDTVRELEEKIDEYLQAGVRLVWVLNPDLETVKVLRPDGTIVVQRGNDDLTGEGVLPGFRCKVSELFEMPQP
jgi:Uma2 family endonuclease